ncbi:MAG TPA: hypothetical protein VII38_04890 [Polyangia bacterium]|jgi:hypothetical protein
MQRARLASLAVCLMFAAAGCASSSIAPGGKDMAGGNMICPNHADQCGGQCCGDVCVDTQHDPLNCGGCGQACAGNTACQGGSCGCLVGTTTQPCADGYSCCNGVGCKNLMNDANNCGACGRACGNGSSCMGGQCVCGSQSCSAGQICCAGACAQSCGTPDMGSGGQDMGSSSGLCQCSDHCANDPIVPWCMGTNCCYSSAIIGVCNAGPCSPNMSP